MCQLGERLALSSVWHHQGWHVSPPLSNLGKSPAGSAFYIYVCACTRTRWPIFALRAT